MDVKMVMMNVFKILLIHFCCPTHAAQMLNVSQLLMMVMMMMMMMLIMMMMMRMLVMMMMMMMMMLVMMMMRMLVMMMMRMLVMMMRMLVMMMMMLVMMMMMKMMMMRMLVMMMMIFYCRWRTKKRIERRMRTMMTTTTIPSISDLIRSGTTMTRTTGKAEVGVIHCIPGGWEP